MGPNGSNIQKQLLPWGLRRMHLYNPFPSFLSHPLGSLFSAKLARTAGLLHLRVCLFVYECLPAGKLAHGLPPQSSSPKLKQAGCDCEQTQLAPAAPGSQLQKVLFHVHMQITISSLERARTVFQSEWGAERNRGSGRTCGQGCRDGLCCPEVFPEFREWSVHHRRC